MRDDSAAVSNFTVLLRPLPGAVTASAGLLYPRVTSFPDGVRRSPSLWDGFVAWARQLQSRPEARPSYARYENGYWEFGDIGAGSSVFLALNEGERDPEQQPQRPERRRR